MVRYVMEAMRKQELKENLPVIRMEIDYELATLYDAMQTWDTVQMIKSKQRLKQLRHQCLEAQKDYISLMRPRSRGLFLCCKLKSMTTNIRFDRMEIDLENGGRLMTHEDFEHVYEYAKQWVLEAGALIRDKIDTPMTINTKSNPKDLVTTMDKETERFFVQRIKEQFPDHLLLTEEGYGDDIVSMDGTVWIIDPIDGTMNFVHQKSNFAISVAIYHNGIGQIGLIYNVMDDILYSARKNSGAFKNDTKLAKLKNDVTL